MVEFSQLETVRFQQMLKPPARRIYQHVFPGCEIQDLRDDQKEVHILDKEFGVDSLLIFHDHQWISVQEKFRTNEATKYFDFTLEYLNDDGGMNESPGEYFKLGAQLYFYGWSNPTQDDFMAWMFLDIFRLKLILNRLGGIENAGQKRHNSRHGRASFYCIPIWKIRKSIVLRCGVPERLLEQPAVRYS